MCACCDHDKKRKKKKKYLDFNPIFIYFFTLFTFLDVSQTFSYAYIKRLTSKNHYNKKLLTYIIISTKLYKNKIETFF